MPFTFQLDQLKGEGRSKTLKENKNVSASKIWRTLNAETIKQN